MQRYIFLILLPFLLFSCKKKAATSETEENMEAIASANALTDMPNDFLAFYKKFHRDSTFQLSHITFPLEGKSTEIDSLGNEKHSFNWNKDNWRLHQSFDMLDTTFNRQYINDLNDRLITENIFHTNGTFAIQRRFYKTGEAYFLIYYNVINNMDMSNIVVQ